jgi:hypothetical protein
MKDLLEVNELSQTERGEPAATKQVANMQIGLDSFAARFVAGGANGKVSPSDSIRNLVQRIELADQAGLDVFGVGEHHRREFLDSAPAVILAAAAARTQRIRLTSAVTVLSAADPVRAFQNFATLDLLSAGRVEMVVGRGSSTESFPLFGLQLKDYDSLFAEKLDLLLKLRENEFVHWSGEHRAPLTGQGVYPRPLQNPLPIWLGVGDAGVVRPCRDAGVAADGRHHWRRNAAIPSARRYLSGIWQARGTWVRPAQGRSSRPGLRR